MSASGYQGSTTSQGSWMTRPTNLEGHSSVRDLSSHRCVHKAAVCFHRHQVLLIHQQTHHHLTIKHTTHNKMHKTLAAVALLALFACALAQNADDARALGEPGNNYCEALCQEAVKRNNAYAKLTDFCKKECNNCVDAVAKTTQGKGEALPAPCKTAYNFKEIPAIISDFQAGKLTASKTGRR